MIHSRSRPTRCSRSRPSQDGDGDGDDAARRAGQGRSERAGAAVPARISVQDEAVSREVAIWHLLTHTPGWEGQLNSEDRGAADARYFVDDDEGPAAAGGAGRGVELQQRGLQRRRPRDRSRHRAVDPRRASGTLVFEPLGLTRAFTRLEDSRPIRSRSRIAARPARSASAGRSRDRFGRRRRRVDEPQRPARLREDSISATDRRGWQACAVACVARIDAHAEGGQNAAPTKRWASAGTCAKWAAS